MGEDVCNIFVMIVFPKYDVLMMVATEYRMWMFFFFRKTYSGGLDAYIYLCWWN